MLHPLLWWTLFGDDTAEAAVVTPPAPDVAPGELVHVFCTPIFSDVRANAPTPVWQVTGGWEPNSPIQNVGTPYLHQVARSLDATMTSTQARCFLGATFPIGALIIPVSNLSPAATYRWSFAHTVGELFGITGYQTTWLPRWPAGFTAEELSGINVAAVYLPATPLSYSWVQLEINDTTNPDGYVELGRLLIAGAYSPQHAMSVGGKQGLEDDTVELRTVRGGSMFATKPVRRNWQFAIDEQLESLAIRYNWGMQRRLGRAGQLFFVFDRDDPFMHERAFLCTQRTLSGVEYPETSRTKTAHELVEVL